MRDLQDSSAAAGALSQQLSSPVPIIRLAEPVRGGTGKQTGKTLP
ncbi:hypothetical protein [Pontixanthobacter sp.]